MPTRRQTLRLAGAVAVLGSASGCLGAGTEGGVGVRIENRTDRQHAVGVTFETGDETVFSDQYTVSADEEMATSDVVDAGDYLVTVERDSSKTETVDLR